jgi:hypothetical protein
LACHGEEARVLQETQDREEIIERVAALDIGKAEVVCCLRVPQEGRPGRRLQEVEAYSTMTGSLLGMADRLACLGVTRVVMEATSDYWKPVFYVLEAAGFETWLVNAKDVKHLPGRPKTDLLTELFDVAAGQSADNQRCGQRRPAQRTVLHGGGGTRLELIAAESGHAVRYRLPAFSSLLLAAPAGNGRAAVETASDQLICLVF